MIFKLTLFLSLSLILFCQNEFAPSKKSTQDIFLNVKLNEKFEIGLDANHSTAYKWYWINKNSNSNVDSVGFEYELKYKGKATLVGGGGVETWHFLAKKECLDSIVFHHKGFVDDKIAHAKVFYINVKK
jgi:predicted secreted protein